MDEYYNNILKELSIEFEHGLDVQTHNSIGSRLIEFLPSIIFYNKAGHTYASPKLEFSVRDGIFLDTSILQRMDSINKALIELLDKNITTEDILKLKVVLSDYSIGNLNETRNLIDNKSFGDYRDEKRRYLLPLGDICVLDFLKTIDKDIENVTNILNRKNETSIGAFLTAMEFHMHFAKLHPLTNCDGRINKLLTNLYLLREGLDGIIITNLQKQIYNDSLNMFSAFGVKGIFIATMLLARRNGAELQSAIKKTDPATASSNMFKDLILTLTNDITTKSLDNDIRKFYGQFKKGDKEMELVALWLLGYAKLNNENILLDAYRNEDKDIRGMAMLSMSKINLIRYCQYLKEGLEDSESSIRILSVGLLAKNGLLNPLTVSNIIKGETDELVLTALTDHLRYAPRSVSYTEPLAKLMDSDSINVRMRAFAAFFVNADLHQRNAILCTLKYQEPEVILQTLCTGFERELEIFNEEKIAAAVSAIALENTHILRLLLRSMTRIPEGANLSKHYVEMCSRVLNDSNYKELEKAFAVYVLGKQKGYKTLSEEYCIIPDVNNGVSINTALILSNSNDLKLGKANNLDSRLFTLNGKEVSIAIGVSLKEVLDNGKAAQLNFPLVHTWTREKCLLMKESVLGNFFDILSNRIEHEDSISIKKTLRLEVYDKKLKSKIGR